MNILNVPILVCTNGDDHTLPALEYSIWLASLLQTRVVFLGIREVHSDPDHIEQLIKSTAGRLDALHIPYEVRMDAGNSPEVIARHANTANYLTVISPLGRPTWQRIVQGRSFRRMLSHIQGPIMYVREARSQIKKILVCMGGLEYSAGIERFSLELAKLCEADITLLHVVEPVTLQYPIAREIGDHWRTVIDTDTPQGRHLRRVYEAAQANGVPVQFHARHGNIVHEIVDEARRGEYDLIAMGSAYSAHSLRHLYMPNVTAEVAESIMCPVLTIRSLVEPKIG